MDKTVLIRNFIIYGTTRRLNGWQNLYKQLFDKIGDPSSILEIGCGRGMGMAAWLAALPSATVHGIEIDETLIPVQETNVERSKVVFGDAILQSTMDQVDGEYDVIIDDASRNPDDQFGRFLKYSPLCTKAYVVENIVGKFHADVMMRRIASQGYVPYCFTGSQSEQTYIMSGTEQQHKHYALLCYRPEVLT